jgi:hypothetical protein
VIRVVSILFLLCFINRGVVIAKGWTVWVRFLAKQKFSSFHSVQTGSASYPMGTGGDFPGDKAVGA